MMLRGGRGGGRGMGRPPWPARMPGEEDLYEAGPFGSHPFPFPGQEPFGELHRGFEFEDSDRFDEMNMNPFEA